MPGRVTRVSCPRNKATWRRVSFHQVSESFLCGFAHGMVVKAG